MTSQTHVLKTHTRTHRVVVTEHPNHVEVDVRCSRYGTYSDLAQFRAWLLTILEPYDSDPRPFRMRNHHSGEVATVYGDSKASLGIIQPGPV